ncbi:nicotinate (nicotinamide) nucleotide adenylyltransferase [Saccharicrinis fermentans]|nr:nicotinate (nicotinamide) nucleotide adenylyltransferase [Saccharicrinis fermentans]
MDKNIGLYFGSFNPVHVGHLALANFIVENTSLDEIWFIVSPQNPYKNATELCNASHRVNMLRLSISQYTKFKVCDIELKLATPSYTYATMRELRKTHPEHRFTIIIGSDNLPHLRRWKNAEEIITHHSFIVYPRPLHPINPQDLSDQIQVFKAPVFDIDSTSIRKGIRNGKDYRFLVPQEVFQYITDNHLFL